MLKGRWPWVGVCAVAGCLLALLLAICVCLARELADPVPAAAGPAKPSRLLSDLAEVAIAPVLGALLGWGVGGLSEARR